MAAAAGGALHQQASDCEIDDRPIYYVLSRAAGRP